MVSQVFIENYIELRDQFGVEQRVKTLNTTEIIQLLRKEVSENNIPIVACIPYQKNNFDSGICTFQLVKYLKGSVTYCYTGTAK